MTCNRRGILLPAVWVCGLILLSSAVWAQSTPSAAAADQNQASATAPATAAAGSPGTAAEQQGNLQEVVITAERRTENLQTTPVAAEVVNAEQLLKNNVEHVTDIQSVTPDLSFGTGNVATVRGIGLGVYAPTTTSGVIEYRDGVLLTHEPLMQDPFYDVAGVTVLRGPQSTAVGSSSTAGAVLVNTENPVIGSFSGYTQQEIGNYREVRDESAINIPVNDDFAMRIAAYEGRNQGFYSFEQNVGQNGTIPPKTLVPELSPGKSLGTDLGSETQIAMRLTMLWKPSTDFTLLWKTDYDNYQGMSQFLTAGEPDPYSPYYAYQPHNANGPIPFETDNYYPGAISALTNYRSIVTTDWEFAPGVDFRDQTAYAAYLSSGQTSNSLDAYNAGFSTTGDLEVYDYTQEFDLLSNGTQPLQWIFGLFSFIDNVGYNGPVVTYPAPGATTTPSYEIYVGDPRQLTYAAFGQVTYNLTSKWQVEIGARYTHDRRWDDTGCVCYLDDTTFPGGKTTINNFNEKDDLTTGKAALNYIFDPDDLLYISWSRGAKAGGYNSGYVAGTTKTLPTFNPETDIDYELGLKSSFLDQHMRLQADVFDMVYQHYQVAVPNIVNGVAIPPTPVANIAGAEDYGLELQLQAALGGWRFDVNGAYLQTVLEPFKLWDVRYNEFVELAGHKLPNAPHLTGNADVEYAFQLAGGGNITPRVQLTYTGGQYWTLFDNSDSNGANRDWTGGYAVTNLDLSITPSGAPAWLIELYAQNALNRLYLSGIASTANDKTHTGNDSWLFGAPATYGVRATYSF